MNLAKDDWDGKTMDENTWNPHWKSHVMETQNRALVMKYQPMRKLHNPTLHADTLTNDDMENFKTQWHNEAEPKKEGRKQQRIANSATRPKKDGKVCRPFQSWDWSSNKQFV